MLRKVKKKVAFGLPFLIKIKMKLLELLKGIYRSVKEIDLNYSYRDLQSKEENIDETPRCCKATEICCQ
jgi:hypothetical protein